MKPAIDIRPLTPERLPDLAGLFEQGGDPKWCWYQSLLGTCVEEKGRAMDDYGTRVWNRAAMQGGGVTPRTGDRMLSAMLQAHGLISNGGVLHALEMLTAEEMNEAIEGYRYFSLDEVAGFLALEAGVAEAERTDDDESRLDSTYAQLIPTDSTFDAPFTGRLRQSPEDFAP